MDETSPLQHSIASSKVKHKFFQWTTKWCYGNIEQGTEKPDVPGVVCLLQALGCQLREYEKNDVQDEKLKSNSMRIILECGNSRMRAVLELDDVNCQCSRPEDAKEASYWSVCGTGPTSSCDSINKFEETGSNLLPPVSRDDRAMIRDVLNRLLDTINSKGEVNHNSTMNLSTARTEDVISPMNKSESLTRSFTQPEIYRTRDITRDIITPPQIVSSDRRMSMSAQNIRNLPLMTNTVATPDRSPKPSLLQRQNTWDIDTTNDGEPRPSPPKISSSPVVLGDLCSSLGQVSLQSDEENLSIAECLRRIKFYVEKAQNSYANVSPGKNDDKVFVKPLPLRSKMSLGGVNSRPSSSCSSPGSLASKSIIIQKPIARRSIGATLTSKQTGVTKTTPTQLPPRRKSIGSSLQPTLKLAMTTAQRNVNNLKKAGSKATPTTSSNSSLSSTDSRVLLSAKRRISPDPKSMSPMVTKPGIPHLKTLTPRPPGVNRSLSAIPGVSSGAKGNTSLAKGGIGAGVPRRSVSPNPLSRKSAIGVSKLSLVKKDNNF